MKISKTKPTKLSNYYRTSSYVQGLEQIANMKSTTLYPYIANDLEVNRSEGLKLNPINSNYKTHLDKVEAIKPIGEDDSYT